MDKDEIITMTMDPDGTYSSDNTDTPECIPTSIEDEPKPSNTINAYKAIVVDMAMFLPGTGLNLEFNRLLRHIADRDKDKE